MKYSITKALVVYRPHEIIKCLYGSPEDFLEELKRFFRDRIEYNKNNPELKQAETMALKVKKVIVVFGVGVFLICVFAIVVSILA